MLSSYSAKITHRHLVLSVHRNFCTVSLVPTIWWQTVTAHAKMVSGAKQGQKKTGNGSSWDKDEVLISKYFQYNKQMLIGLNFPDFFWIFGSKKSESSIPWERRRIRSTSLLEPPSPGNQRGLQQRSVCSRFP